MGLWTITTALWEPLTAGRSWPYSGIAHPLDDIDVWVCPCRHQLGSGREITWETVGVQLVRFAQPGLFRGCHRCDRGRHCPQVRSITGSTWHPSTYLSHSTAYGPQGRIGCVLQSHRLMRRPSTRSTPATLMRQGVLCGARTTMADLEFLSASAWARIVSTGLSVDPKDDEQRTVLVHLHIEFADSTVFRNQPSDQRERLVADGQGVMNQSI